MTLSFSYKFIYIHILVIISFLQSTKSHVLQRKINPPPYILSHTPHVALTDKHRQCSKYFTSLYFKEKGRGGERILVAFQRSLDTHSKCRSWALGEFQSKREPGFLGSIPNSTQTLFFFLNHLKKLRPEEKGREKKKGKKREKEEREVEGDTTKVEENECNRKNPSPLGFFWQPGVLSPTERDLTIQGERQLPSRP